MGDREITSVATATESIKNSKAVFVITDMENLADIKGYIYYVSKSESTYPELLSVFKQIGESGERAMLIGSYNNGGAIGVQYEIQQ